MRISSARFTSLYSTVFAAVCVAFSVAVFTGCQPTVDSGSGNLSSSPAAPKADAKPSSDRPSSPAGTPKTSTPVTAKPPKPEPVKADGPPNWNARYAELVGEVKKRWELPPDDRKVSITMKNGASREGYVLGVAKDRATFNVLVPGSTDPQRATIQRTMLNDKTRIMLWVDDASKYHATMRVKKEKAKYERDNAPAIAAQIPSANRPTQTSTTVPRNSQGEEIVRVSGPGVIKPRVRGVVQHDDGSVDSVVMWLRDNINNPRSIRIHRWGKLVRDPRPGVQGYNLDVTFSSDAGGVLGTIRETKRFFFNREGNITTTANVRQ